jgi:hypothetical protein
MVHTMVRQTARQTQPCLLIPQCHNGPHNTASNLPVGPFHTDDSQLAHDLHHLQPGSVFSPPAFLLLAESWFAAEAGRWWHQKKHVDTHDNNEAETAALGLRRQPSRAAKKDVTKATTGGGLGTTTPTIAVDKRERTPAEKRKETMALKKTAMLLNGNAEATRGAYHFRLEYPWAHCPAEEMTVEKAGEEKQKFMDELAALLSSRLKDAKGSQLLEGARLWQNQVSPLGCFCERPEMQLSPEDRGLVAPEPDMIFSPTLGSWPAGTLGSGKTVPATRRVAALNALKKASCLLETLEIYGLIFAVDGNGMVWTL